MTNEEAAEILQGMKSDFPLPKAAQTRRAQNDALDAAIKALKAEPCEDAVSRQAAIDAVHRNYDTILDFKSDGRTVAGSFEDIINALPSVQPEAKKISYTDCANAMLMMWMDEVLTDGEYHRIMDKLNEHEKRCKDNG